MATLRRPAVNVTVAIATRGRPDALLRCVEAIGRQATPPSELIVVDQAPTAEARAATQSSGLPAVRYLEQEPLGLSASRNLALRAASGSVLAVTDDDCAPDTAWLEAITAAFERPSPPAAVTGPVLPLGVAPRGTFAVSLRESSVPVEHAGRVLPWDVGSGGNFAASVQVLRECGGWDERLGAGSPGQAAEDSDLLYRLLRRGLTIRYEPRAVVRHEWQTRARRLATRWSYGFGIGAMCGIWLTRGDPYAARMLAGYARLHVRPLLGGLRHGDTRRIGEHGRALASVMPGLLHGARVGRRPRTASVVAPP